RIISSAVLRIANRDAGGVLITLAGLLGQSDFAAALGLVQSHPHVAVRQWPREFEVLIRDRRSQSRLGATGLDAAVDNCFLVHPAGPDYLVASARVFEDGIGRVPIERDRIERTSGLT